MHIITVCTANICRSPSTAALLRVALEQVLPGAVVTSAGVAAEPDYPACGVAASLVSSRSAGEAASASVAHDLEQHRSALLEAERVARADLVLALDRSHRSAIARLHPAGRPRTFTLRQAAAAADQVASSLAVGELPEGAPPIPQDPTERFAWWVAELDAARAFLPGGPEETIGSLTVDPHDVPDPHVVGFQHHRQAVDYIATAVDTIAESLRLLAGLGLDDGSPILKAQQDDAS